jgi:hypothetical protein
VHAFYKDSSQENSQDSQDREMSTPDGGGDHSTQDSQKGEKKGVSGVEVIDDKTFCSNTKPKERDEVVRK